MFSRSKRFSKPSEKESNDSPPCERYNHHHDITSTPIQRPAKPRIPRDLLQFLNRLQKLEDRIQTRCHTMDSLFSEIDSGYTSTRSSSPIQEEDDFALVPAFEDSLSPDELVELCAAKIFDLVWKKLEARQGTRKSFWDTTRELFWPKIVTGSRM